MSTCGVWAPGCSIKHLGAEEEAEAAEWLQAHPVKLVSTRPTVPAARVCAF
jgi:hypothetical protein